MTSPTVIAAAALLQAFHCSAAPEMATTIAPTPAGEYISIADRNGKPFDFDVKIKGHVLNITVSEDHAVFGKGSHDFWLVVDSPTEIYQSVGDPCMSGQRPCYTTANFAKGTDGSLTFIVETMWAVKLGSPSSPSQTFIRPGMTLVHGTCKPAEVNS